MKKRKDTIVNDWPEPDSPTSIFVAGEDALEHAREVGRQIEERVLHVMEGDWEKEYQAPR